MSEAVSWRPRVRAAGVGLELPPYVPLVAVLGAMSFNLFLCFANTNLSTIGNGYIIGVEIIIIASVLILSYPIVDYIRLLFVSSALCYLLGLVLVRFVFFGDAIDVKPVRDLLIPITFFLLGARVRDIRLADTLVRVATFIVVAVALFEYVFPDSYTKLFNVAKFYIERGVMDAAAANQSSGLFISGTRPAGYDGGRHLLPFLGEHRASSIFLEPISLGNYGIIVFVWALVRSMFTRRIYWALFTSALVLIVLSDSRFGAYFCAICLAVAVLPTVIRSAAVTIMPAAGLLTLLALPDLLNATYASNGFIGRLILSGHILDRMDFFNWLGVKTPAFSTFDSGYAYVICAVGIFGVPAFWIAFLLVEGRGRQFLLMRNLTYAYYAVLLCVSNSPFTIKTASLLWFLIGVLSDGDGIRRPNMQPRRFSAWPWRQTARRRMSWQHCEVADAAVRSRTRY